MNNVSQIKEYHANIGKMLERQQLKQAIDALAAFIKEVPEWDLHSLFDETQTAYRYMLQYFSKGVSDPHREQLYTELIRKTFIVNERLMRARLELFSSEVYYSTMRQYRNEKRRISDFQLIFESFTEDMAMARLLNEGDVLKKQTDALRTVHEEDQNTFFCKVWTSPVWNAQQLEEARNFIGSVLVPTNDTALFVSAVTMGVLQIFDVQKINFLFDAYAHANPQVSQRALVGIVLICLTYGRRIAYEPELQSRLQLLQEKPDYKRHLLNIQIQLLRSRETKKADRKMRDEIIPEVMKSTRNFDRSKFRLINPEEDLFTDDKNPEWKKWEENTELTHKIQELGNMQMEGIDVYMSTFAQLKTFPFFRNLCNWFYPFDPQHSAVLRVFPEEEQKNNFIVNHILASSFFCNSDKYSFCLTIENIPKAQREAFSGNLTEQNEMFKEMQKTIATDRDTAEVIVRQYVQDLYRFYKIYPRRHEFNDVFENVDLNFRSCAVLQPFLSDADSMRTVAEYLFHKEYYGEAESMFAQLAEEGNGTDAELFQKLGFCYQKEKEYAQAIEAYLKADFRKPDTLWTVRHLAQCYKLTKQPEKALPYYRKALEIQPDNTALLLHTGECEAELRSYDEAFARFFKVEYLKPDSVRSWRDIAWCSFVTCKYEQADKYYARLLEQDKPEATDFLNAAHNEWAQQRTEQAAQLYIKGCRMQNDTEAFIALLMNDADELAQKGITAQDLTLMADVIRYGMQEAD